MEDEMGTTHRLYCNNCYLKFKDKLVGKTQKVVQYNSYFSCSGCSLETDRGYAIFEAVQNNLNLGISAKYKKVDIA